MKFFNNNKNKVLAGTIAALAIVAISVALIKNIPNNQAVLAANDDKYTAESTLPETTTTPAATKATTTTAKTTPPEETTTAPQSSEIKPPETRPAETTVKTVEVTLAPVEVPDEEVLTILEENNIQIVDNPPMPAQTTPPPTSGMPEGAQGVDENGWYFKREDGIKYVWHPVLGWGKDSEDGNTIIMEVESDGYSFYEEPDGSINLNKVVTPDGKIITYDEYKIIKESR